MFIEVDNQFDNNGKKIAVNPCLINIDTIDSVRDLGGFQEGLVKIVFKEPYREPLLVEMDYGWLRKRLLEE